MSQAEADAPDIPRCHDANRNENINAMQAPVFYVFQAPQMPGENELWYSHRGLFKRASSITHRYSVTGGRIIIQFWKLKDHDDRWFIWIDNMT